MFKFDIVWHILGLDTEPRCTSSIGPSSIQLTLLPTILPQSDLHIPGPGVDVSFEHIMPSYQIRLIAIAWLMDPKDSPVDGAAAVRIGVAESIVTLHRHPIGI